MNRTPLKRRSRGGAEKRRIRAALEKRSGGRCEARVDEKCYGRATEVHHRKLRAQGGGNRQENLLHVCAHCHREIHAHPTRAYERGWLVSAYRDPADVPVRPAHYCIGSDCWCQEVAA